MHARQAPYQLSNISSPQDLDSSGRQFVFPQYIQHPLFSMQEDRMALFPLAELFPQEKPINPTLKHKVTLCFPTNG